MWNRGHKNISLSDANVNDQNKSFFDTFVATLEEPASRDRNYTHHSQAADSDGTRIGDANAEPQSQNNDAIPLQTIKAATRSGFGSLWNDLEWMGTVGKEGTQVEHLLH